MKISAVELNSKKMADKPILAIETSESICGVAVYFSDEKYFESELKDKYSHAERLFNSIDYVMQNASIEMKDIGAIAVSSGPGSFTGLRIGMSAAKGLALGVNIPIIPVPTFEALALQISEFLQDDQEFIIANNVNKDEIYYAKFQIKDNKYIFVDELQVMLKSDLSCLDSIKKFGNVFIDINQVFDRRWNLAVPSAVYVAKWAKNFGVDSATFDFDFLEPNYLKNFIAR